MTSWDCPRMREVQKEWESLLDTAKKARGREAVEKYGFKGEKLNDMLDRIFTSNLT